MAIASCGLVLVQFGGFSSVNMEIYKCALIIMNPAWKNKALLHHNAKTTVMRQWGEVLFS